MRKRDFYFDNAKFILIFFVVFGHLLRSYIEDNVAVYTIYKVIYTFHMPAFILISGYFAKGFNKKGYLPKIAKKLILPYFIFQLIYSVFYYFLYNKEVFQMDLLLPQWSLWFLISLFFWNLMLKLFTKYRPLYAVAAALLCGLAIGYFDWAADYLSISRTFVFFPLFLIGYYMKKKHFYSLFKPQIQATALMVFAIVFIGFYLHPNINYEWLLGSKPYTELEVTSLTGIFTRFGYYILSLIMVFSFFSLVPKKQFFFTTLGKNTLYVYLLHGFFIKVFRERDLQTYFSDLGNLLLLACVSLLLSLLLSSKLITSFTQPLIELKTSKLKNLKIKIRTLLHFYRKKLLNSE